MKPRTPRATYLTATEAHQITDSAITELNDWQLTAYLAADTSHPLISGIMKLVAQENTSRRARLTTEEIEEILNSVITEFSERQLNEYLYAKEQENDYEYLTYFGFIIDPLVRGVVKIEQRLRTLTD